MNCIQIPQAQQAQTKVDEQDHHASTDDNDFEFRGYYKFSTVLGKGAYGTVIECQRKYDQKPVAIKFIKTKGIYKWTTVKNCKNEENNKLYEEILFKPNEGLTESSSIPLEVACLIRAAQLDGIIKVLEYWSPFSASYFNMDEDHHEEDVSSSGGEHHSPKCDDTSNHGDEGDDDKFIAIIFERNYNEISLYEYLYERNYLKEPEAKQIFKQIVEISLSLLNINILHGDLKCENMLIDMRTGHIQLIDFGSAVLLDSNPRLCAKTIKAFRGTNLYKPPEYVVNHSFYPRPSTVWTLGIILYNLVCGDFPFQNENEILEHKDKEIPFKYDINLSCPLKDLIKRCLAFYTADRICIEKVLIHQWMS